MTRIEALSALFEIGSTQATQEAVDLVRDHLERTEDDYEELSDSVIHRMRAFENDPEFFLDSIVDQRQKAFLRQLVVLVRRELPEDVLQLIRSDDWNCTRTAIERVFANIRNVDPNKKAEGERHFLVWLRRMTNYKNGYTGVERCLFGEHMLQCIEALQRGDDLASTEYRQQFVTGSYTDGELLPP